MAWLAASGEHPRGLPRGRHDDDDVAEDDKGVGDDGEDADDDGDATSKGGGSGEHPRGPPRRRHDVDYDDDARNF